MGVKMTSSGRWISQLLAVPVALFVLVVGLSGCTWVALTPEAESVRIGTVDEQADCTRVGTTKARTKSKIGIFARGQKKVAEELSTLARNDSVELGGNTVVADGPVTAEGTQRFTIYDCPTEP
jgi:hypothetical protein